LKSGADVTLGRELTLLALEVDPIPQGQMNSDKRKSDAVFACFLDEQYEHCLEIASDISTLAPITWLFAAAAYLALGQDLASSGFLLRDLSKYADTDFVEEIGKLKLEDRVVVNQLRELCSTKIKAVLSA
jgi:hypothetical protein